MSEEKKGEEEANTEDYEKKRKKKTKAEIEAEALASDLYKILGLEDNHEATEAQIAKAYRKAALLYHPDKLGDKLNEHTK
jgi:DnaJ-class molecular chaperone